MKIDLLSVIQASLTYPLLALDHHHRPLPAGELQLAGAEGMIAAALCSAFAPSPIV